MSPFTDPPVALLPCPFCQGAPTLRQMNGGWWTVECEYDGECYASPSTVGATDDEACDRWNDRRPFENDAAAGSVDTCAPPDAALDAGEG